MTAASLLRDLIEIGATALLMVLGLRVFAIEIFRIPTPSMMPTLMGTRLMDPVSREWNGRVHDRVLVDKLSYLLRDPERWEVVVFRYPLAVVGQPNYVKRVAGLPGEELFLQYGDVWARPLGSEEAFRIQRKPWRLQQRLWKKVRPLPGEEPRHWIGWTLTGRNEIDGDGTARLLGKSRIELHDLIHDDYRDGYPDAIRERVPIQANGSRWTNVLSDLRLLLSLTPGAEPSALRLRADFGPFPVRLALEPASGTWTLSLPGGREERGALAPSAGSALHVDLSLWDHRVRLAMRGGGEPVLREIDLAQPPAQATSNGFVLTTEGGGWSLGLPVIQRDIHYLSSVSGSNALFEVPEGEYFMLGDNTQSSHDGRDWTAYTFGLDPPLEGWSRMRGDLFQSGDDPALTNPRNTRSDENFLIFRDHLGELYAVPRASMANEQRIPQFSVPREYILGKALLVSWPWWPVNRVGWVR